MKNEDAIKGLKAIKTYCASNLLKELEYAIQILEKLDMDGISNPLETDFKKLKDCEEK